MNDTVRTKVKGILKKDEGCELKPYTDTEGKLSIGYGRNLEDVGITYVEADFMLEADISRIDNAGATFPWIKELSENRQVVIYCMIYNMGLMKFCGFKKMITAIQSKDFDKVYNEMLNSHWASQVGARATRLAEIMRNG